MGQGNRSGGEGYLIEFRRLGGSVKVSACDPVTLIEVSIVGGAATPEWMLERTVVRKLEAAIAQAATRGGARR
jgi:hypothetical protein